MTNNRDDDYRGYPNQVQLGINDTPLTIALTNGDFKTAEKIIMENNEPGYLDEGPFDKIPLSLVLSTENDQFPRHLRLAKLMAERGANVNLRIPQTEWQGATPSPMEYIVDLYIRVKDICKYGTIDGDETRLDKIALDVIGLHDETELEPPELKEQLLELLDVFVACGGNPNVTTTTSNSTLYHVVLIDSEPDVNFIMKLCEAGGDLNQTNVHGTTPLMDLVTYAECDTALDILKNIWEKQPDISSLDTQNCSNETTLWRAMLAGSPQLTIELLERGADPTPRATVACGKWHRGKKYLHSYARETVKSGISAIFAPLLQNSSPYLHYASVCTVCTLREYTMFDFNISLFNKVMACTLYPVIDSTYFSESFPEKVLNEMESVVESETKFKVPDMVPQGGRVDDVAVLMFGNLKGGLQQMCVRTIVNEVFFAKPPRKSQELIMKLKKDPEIEIPFYDQEENWDEDSSVDFDKEYRKEFARKFEEIVDEWEVAQDLSPSAIQCLVQEHLGLPGRFTSFFQIEAARLQLGSSLYTLESIDCLQGCDGESDASTDNLLDDDLDDDDDDESSWEAGLESSGAYDYTLDWKAAYQEGFSDEDDDEDMEVSSTDSCFRPTTEMLSDANPEQDPQPESNPSNSESIVSVTTTSNTSSGDTAPKDIRREEYESFSNEVVCEDTSPVTDMDVGDKETVN